MIYLCTLRFCVVTLRPPPPPRQMKQEFAGWRPVDKPRHGIVTVKEWKALLEHPLNKPYNGGEAVMEPYERLMWEVWMPHIRTAFRSVLGHGKLLQITQRQTVSKRDCVMSKAFVYCNYNIGVLLGI